LFGFKGSGFKGSGFRGSRLKGWIKAGRNLLIVNINSHKLSNLTQNLEPGTSEP
jgi:hypothetical protein